MREIPQNKTVVVAVVCVAIVAGIIARQRYNAGTAAYVNGERIFAGPILTTIEKLRDHDPERFKGERGRREEESVKRMLIDRRIELRQIGQAASSAGVEVTEEDINASLATQAKTFKSESEFYEAMAGQGLVGRILREETRDILAKEKMRIKLARQAKVSIAEIESFVASNPAVKAKASSERELYRQVSAKLLKDKRRDSFSGWLHKIKSESSVRIIL